MHFWLDDGTTIATSWPLNLLDSDDNGYNQNGVVGDYPTDYSDPVSDHLALLALGYKEDLGSIQNLLNASDHDLMHASMVNTIQLRLKAYIQLFSRML